MSKIAQFKALYFLIIVWTFFNHTAYAFSVDTLKYGTFGKVTIYKPNTDPKSVVLFVSGDGGWNSGVVGMAQKLVQQSALVAGIDIKLYSVSKKTCNLL